LLQLICFDSPLQGLDPNGVTAVSHNCRNIAAFVLEITAVHRCFHNPQGLPMNSTDCPPPSASPTPDLTSPHRRKLLWGLPAGLMVQGCGGGATAVAAAVSPTGVDPVVNPPANPPPGPTPTPTPTPTPSLIVTSTWAARPAASASLGQGMWVSDVGVGGSLWFSNGISWMPVSNPLVLAHKFSNARMDASVGANADVLLDSHLIPAFLLGPASSLRITAAFSFPGSGTANKAPQIRAYFGVGKYAVSSQPLLDSRGQFTFQKSFLLNVTLQNRNALSSNQIRPNDYGIGASGNAFSTSSIDFSQDVTVGFGALNNSNSLSADDQQMLDWFCIELIA
jgi:hypothetical protein